jgi:hypothetical protein
MFRSILCRKTAAGLGWNIKAGKLGICEPCAVAKAQQKNVMKESSRLATDSPNHRVFIDIASIKKRTEMPMPNTPFWLIIVDECTQLKRVEFFHRKNEIGKYLCELFHMFHKDRSDGRHVRYVRRDNAGENHTYRDRAQSSAWKLNIRFEFGGNRVRRQSTRGKLLSRNICNRVETKKRIGVKQANANSRK